MNIFSLVRLLSCLIACNLTLLSTAQNIKTDFIKLWDQTLYINCANWVSLPKEMDYDNLDFKVEGDGEIIPDSNKQGLTLVPFKKNFQIAIHYKKNLLEKIGFTVIDVPNPIIKLKRGNSEISDLKLDQIRENDGLRFTIHANVDFKSYLPNDARYRIPTFKVNAIRYNEAGLEEVLMTKEIEGTSFSFNHLNTLSFLTRPELLRFEISQIQRKNFKGDVFDVFDEAIIFEIPIE